MAQFEESPKKKHPGGRPTKYSAELAQLICESVAINPCGLPALCKKIDGLPSPDTIKRWRWDIPEFSAKYAEAKRFQAEIMAESIEDIIDETKDAVYHENGVTKVDGGIIAQARLRVDSRKWTASKLAPKIYGDKQIIEQTTSENAELKAELAVLRAQLADKNKSEY